MIRRTAMLLIALTTSIAGAQTETELTSLVDQLDDESFHVREQARARLAHGLVDDQQVMTLLRHGALTAEQRSALDGLLFQRFATRTPGAVGVSFSQTLNDRRGLTITNVTARFPAIDSGMIQQGDLITSVDGLALEPLLRNRRNPTHLYMDATRAVRTRVFSRQPGESVPMTIVRKKEDGTEEVLELDIPLGDGNAHVRLDPSDVLYDAYRHRLNRETGIDQEHIAELPHDDKAWPSPVAVGMPPRLSTSPVSGAPAALTTEVNPADPYSPSNTSSLVRRSFESGQSGMKTPNDPRLNDRLVVRFQNNQVVRRGIGNNAVMRARITRLDASALESPDPQPRVTLERVTRLRDRVTRLTERIARSTDASERARLDELLRGASADLDAIEPELAGTLGGG